MSSGGSHSYEYISSVDIENLSPVSLRLNINIFLVNPDGCTTANPCATYDSSPEYVNVWIDWNGDKAWDSSEQVIAAVGTGYQTISYSGDMYFSSTVAVPGNAVAGQTYCRVMLGWGTNPTSPALESWTWGDVQDYVVDIAGRPEINEIIVFPDNPMTLKDISFSMDMDLPEDYELVKVAWSGPDLTPGEGNPYDTQYPEKIYGNKTVKASVTYRHLESGIEATVDKEKEFKLFFEKAADDDGNGKPNWFEYWKTDGACPTLSDLTTILYDSGLGGYGSYRRSTDTVNVGDLAAGLHYSSPILINGASFGGAKGIDCLEEVLTHELGHKAVYENWTAGSAWVGKVDSDDSSPTADHKDRLPDDFEALLGSSPTRVDTFDLEHIKNEVYQYYGDNEYYVMSLANGATGVVAKDWANPGKQTDPAFDIAAQEDKAGPHTKSGAWKIYDANGPVHSARSQQAVTEDVYGSFATISSVQSLQALDLDASGRYDVLRLALTMTVQQAGYYEVTARLAGPADEPVAYATVSGIFAAGAQDINLDFSGKAIHESKVNGPYTVSELVIKIDNEDANLGYQGNDVIDSPLYTYDQFESQVVEFSGTGSDQIVANMTFRVTLAANVTKAGQYALRAYLYDVTGEVFVVSAETSPTLAMGAQNIDFNFPITPIFFKKINGTQLLKRVVVRDPATSEKYAAKVNYAVTAYDFTTYRPNELRILPASFTEEIPDYDNNGFKDGVFIKLDVERNGIDTERRYRVSALLESTSHTLVSNFEKVIILRLMTNRINLFFPGADINAGGVTGACQVRSLTFVAVDTGVIEENLDRAFTTSALESGQFSQSVMTVLTPFSESGVDSNSNGFFDTLTVNVRVNVMSPGQVVVEGSLHDGQGTFIAHARSEQFFSDPQASATIPLSFDGRAIAAHGVNGPYFLKDLFITHSGLPTSPYFNNDALATAAYLASQFEPQNAAVTGWVLYE